MNKRRLSLKKILMQAQRNICPYCGRGFASIEHATFDHVIPRRALKVARGAHIPVWAERRNCLIAHGECNKKKGHRLPYPCEVLFLKITVAIADSFYAQKQTTGKGPVYDAWAWAGERVKQAKALVADGSDGGEPSEL